MPILLFMVGTVAIAVLLVDNANLDNTAYGQSVLFPNTPNSGASRNPSPILQHYQQQQPPLPNQHYQSNLHFVKITLPTKGQQVLVGKDLLIYGTSTGNATSGCKAPAHIMTPHRADITTIRNGTLLFHQRTPLLNKVRTK
jgi:hypothetical protein